MAKEYIEREAALNAIKDEIENYQPNPDRYSTTPYEFVRRGLNIAYSIIKNQPTADVQKVVRCKECKFSKYSDTHSNRFFKIYFCNQFCSYHRDTDFCNWGVKRSEQE